MTSKIRLVTLGITAVIAFSSAGSVIAGDCGKCASSTTASTVTYHEPQYGEFHEQLLPMDANGKVLGCLDVAGKSVKVGVDITSSTGGSSTWETHTTKQSKATVTEERYAQ
ncbi:hypothetical protein [Thiothrix fructosivorans]|uniref:Secreted protein n=1 Tax=Thiothrix fructosivorans TaxID=111770 RepID=A0A8B0SEY7_9GAMM|nr:hypothetical protein [Thiothrix fructosivorans]MBO0614497.1 hypothetical protein [Thiothrix fructosivorans]QTX09335.1 hypothetical protein J1836_011855 [Thiothrix fructosivorans]